MSATIPAGYTLVAGRSRLEAQAMVAAASAAGVDQRLIRYSVEQGGFVVPSAVAAKYVAPSSTAISADAAHPEEWERLTTLLSDTYLPKYTVRTTTQSITSANVGSGALLADDTLVTSVAPGTFEVRAVIFYDAGTTGDLLIGLVRPSGSTGDLGVIGVSVGVGSAASTGSGQFAATSGGTFSPQPVGGANGGSSRYLTAIVEATVVATVSGTIGIQYAQNATDTTNATIGIGSRMTVRQIA